MANRLTQCQRPVLECLELRTAPSGSPPANVIGTAAGTVSRPHQASETAAAVQSRNITPRKHSTLFGLFVGRNENGSLSPRILGAGTEAAGALPVRHGRAFRAGVHDQTVAFTTTGRPGSLSTAVTGRDQTTGGYVAETTLIGDVNGDGKVDLADLQAFAPTYMSRVG